MTDDAIGTVLQRKVQAQRKALGGGGWSLSRALGRGLSISADALWGLTLVARPTGDDTLPVDRVTRHIGDDRLLVILEHDQGRRGLAAFDRDLVTGLIDIQTLGRVTRFPADARPYTPTDAAMTAPLIDAALPRFASMLSMQPEMAHLQDYRFGALVEDCQAAALALDADSYHLVTFEVSLANDTRSGAILFLFPEPAPDVEGLDTIAQPGKHEAMFKLAPVRMQAILTRIHIPLDRAQALRPGDVLTLSPGATSSATLTMSGGDIVARGKLGQMNGFRAIRIGSGESPLHKPDLRPEQADALQTATALVPVGPDLPKLDYGGSLDMALNDIAAGLPAASDQIES
ncbi:FliM/FliN family flagellar motor C-terminal domain-containing protein [Marivita sp.]|uniref:FliM/FliN family flagellar motor C-terminal domain-containing protein n=1 Tax=Marivita sp. TaxID=2003365 RepID=UPI00260CD45D|nr:FliM/FliN family flagellar motor C-terminal domain-containing protein [Marivita sp.]